VLLQAVRIGFGLFVGHFAQFNVVYGALGALMALLVWAYLSALALLWGAQLAYVYSRQRDQWQGLRAELTPASAAVTQDVAGTMKGWILPGRRPGA
jgi:uncharacterized BrkB/YihY/UPF0761 family membrane protein